MPNSPETYYGAHAYSPDRIPVQPNAPHRSLISRFTGTRLPWGNTQEVTTIDLMKDPTPDDMRFWAEAAREKEEQKAAGTYKPAPFEGAELHGVCNNERFRFAQLPNRPQIWILIMVFAKWTLILMLPLAILVDLGGLLYLDLSAKEVLNGSISILMVVILLPTWLILSFLMNTFPKLWFRPPDGPLWELNRVNGMVTVFKKPSKGKDNTKDPFVAPFYEFDAYIVTHPDRQGLPMNGLFLAHRYSKAAINLNRLFVPDNLTHTPCALWDFFQNFMDVERPLPDIPLFEPYRHLDPVTAAHDQKTGRPPHYWFEMDNDTFKQQVEEMSRRISAIDTFSRPNLMAQYVSYAD